MAVATSWQADVHGTPSMLSSNWPGSFLLTATMLVTGYILAICPYHDAASLDILLPTGIGILLLIATTIHECFYTKSPLLPRLLFQSLDLNLTMTCCVLKYLSGGIVSFYLVFL
ncbi:hypothetical protein B0A48_18691 [Cryoendolithus antarcticus]|uniref:Uncharacterized protein n=1 Tax=Cryoendolithus antarcticus TaxID=1507870 RepID=A0A1V8S8N4_9PEZI|nr:hypothetical protein B0A48_18691 [Cryoendolithus antarcticus]